MVAAGAHRDLGTLIFLPITDVILANFPKSALSFQENLHFSADLKPSGLRVGVTRRRLGQLLEPSLGLWTEV
ncbi:MAG: hypothetical protein RLZZ597_1415 [Cyanobacteriota bacterium]|jgi:hypothetical protein